MLTTTLIGAIASLAPSRVWAATPTRYRVNARIDPATGWVRGVFSVVVDVEPGESSVRLWMLGEKLAHTPLAMDDQTTRWVYPRRAELGSARVQGLFVNGVEVEGRVLPPDPTGAPGGRTRASAGVDLELPLPPGARRVIVSGRFELRVPHRFGRLGRVDGRFSLLAPWYPLVLSREGGWHVEAEHWVRLESVGSHQWLLGGEPYTRDDAQDTTQDNTTDTRAGFVRVSGPYAPAFGAPQFYREELHHRGHRVQLVATRPWYRTPPERARGLASLVDLARPDRLGPISRSVRHALDTLLATGARGVRLPKSVVIVPSRTELAGNAPGMVLVSDRAFEVLPVDAVLGFQERALGRAFFRESMAARARRLDGSLDAGWGADLRAVLLSDLDARRREVELSTPQELLSFAAFNPSVDQLLYAPQVAFVDVYFGAVAEPDVFRDDPDQAREAHARGRLLMEYARDHVADPEAITRLGRSLLQAQRSARSSLLRAGVAADALSTWVAAPRMPLNYRLGSVTSARVEAEEGAHYLHQIEVVREGAQRHETVPLRVRDTEGHVVEAEWDGEGERGVVAVRTPAPLRQVWVDPRARRPQDAGVAGGHPSRDDTNRLPLRPPLLQRLEPSYAGGFGAAISFGIFRKYDLENSVIVDLRLFPRAYGASLRYVRGFGRTRDLNRRVASGSVGAAVERVLALRPGGEDGTRYSVFGALSYNNVRYYLDPRHGEYINAGVRLAWAEGVAGSRGAAVSFSAHGTLLRSPSWRHAFALVADVAGVVGAKLEGQLLGIGGPELLRGYTYTELLGAGRALFVAEYRLTAFADLHVNAFHVFYLREIQLALFTGVGVVMNADDGRAFAPAAEVGAGIRLHFEYGGIQPSLVSFDIGVPLTESPAVQRALPFTTVLGFEQYF